MSETIAAAVVELARYAVMAYAIRNGRDVLVHWLDRTPTRLTDHQLVDAARAQGFTVIEERDAA